MAIIVQKFGGTCLDSLARISEMAELIADSVKEGYKVIAVASAMGDTTDSLLYDAKSICSDCDSRELDVLMSAGEQMSSSMLALALKSKGIKAVSLMGWQAGIKTTSLFGEARIREIDRTRIDKEFIKNSVVVVAGFQGVDKYGNMTTLGRGGSDTTAVALAAAFHAEKCEILTKIDGIYTADPTLIPEAQKIPEISYACMQEMSFLGVKVLNPRAVELAAKNGVPLVVRSAFEKNHGTVVKEDVMERLLISGVTKQSNIARIIISDLPDGPGQAFRIFGLMANANINTDIILQSAGKDSSNDIAFTVAEDKADEAVRLLTDHKDFDAVSVTCDKNVAKVSVVGAGLESHPWVPSAMFEALSGADINILMLSSSELRISVVVDMARADDAMRAIHKRFLGGEARA